MSDHPEDLARITIRYDALNQLVQYVAWCPDNTHYVGNLACDDPQDINALMGKAFDAARRKVLDHRQVKIEAA